MGTGMLPVPTYLAASWIPGAGLGLNCRDFMREARSSGASIPASTSSYQVLHRAAPTTPARLASAVPAPGAAFPPRQEDGHGGESDKRCRSCAYRNALGE